MGKFADIASWGRKTSATWKTFVSELLKSAPPKPAKGDPAKSQPQRPAYNQVGSRYESNATPKTVADNNQKPPKQMHGRPDQRGEQEVRGQAENVWRKARREPIAFFTSVLAICTAVLAVATVFLAGSTIGVWFATTDLAKATRGILHYSEEQTSEMKAAREQTERLTERLLGKYDELIAKYEGFLSAANTGNQITLETSKPVISVEARPISDLYISSGLRLKVAFVLKNTGKMVAKNASIYDEMSLESMSGRRDDAATEQKMCEQVKKLTAGKPDTGFTIPLSIGNTQERSFTVGPKEFQSGTRVEAITDRKFIVPLIFGCMRYQASDNTFLYTGFKIEFRVRDPVQGPRPRIYLDDGGVVAKDLDARLSSSYSE
jgi:hypothetical protein